MAVPLVCGGVMASCSICVFFLERIQKEAPGAMNLLTFSHYLFTSVEGIVLATRFFSRKRVVPIRRYLVLVSVFFVVNVVNNWALSFQIPVPLHIIFKSGTLLTNMALGMWLLQRRYSRQKYAAVVLITVGLIVCTQASAAVQQNSSTSDPSQPEGLSLQTQWLIGLSMMIATMCLSAYLGILQEKLYADYGNVSREVLFYSHLLPLPGFLIFSRDIYRHLLLFNASATFALPLVPIFTVYVPTLWYYLIASVITQYVCIRSIYRLTAKYSSLTVTLVVTLRKFLSLLVSIWYFQNPFTLAHWLGVSLVFVGTLLFSITLKQISSNVTKWFPLRRYKAE